MELDPVVLLAYYVGASAPALRLLLSIAACYPLALYYHQHVSYKSPVFQHAFFTISGLIIGFFNFGFSIYHSLIAVLVIYASIKVFGPGKITTIVTFTFNMTYLIMGYWCTESETYDITWTMPHCVLALKLIGLSFDLWDGTLPEATLSTANKATALRTVPTLTEVTAFTYFPATFLVGPQFSMARYLKFTHGKFHEEGQLTSVYAGMKRGLLGILYLIIYQIGVSFYSDEYLLSETYENSSIFYKHFVLGIWGKICLYKYISCWLLTEALCMTFGIAYSGIEQGQKQWEGCCNVKLQVFEGATRFGHYIESFNVNTNAWIAQYVYKRLIFLGNRYYSQGLSLLFLAVWHGLHSGYYMTFLMEFAIMFMEKECEPMLNKNEYYQKVTSNPIVSVILFVLLKFYTIVFMGFCMVPFSLKTFPKWWHVYKTLYFSGIIFFFPWPVVYKPILKNILKKLKPAVHRNLE